MQVLRLEGLWRDLQVRARAGGDKDAAHPRRQRRAGRQRERPPAGDPQDGKPLNPQAAGPFAYIERHRQQPRSGRRRCAVARAGERQESYALSAGGVVEQCCSPGGARRPGQQHDGLPARLADLDILQNTAIGGPEKFHDRA